MAVLVLAVLVGMFQGGVQALSRSHFAKIIPAEKSGEYFGLFDICGKGASFLGTMIVSVGSQLTGSANMGIGMLALLFAVGFVLFRVPAGLRAQNRCKKYDLKLPTLSLWQYQRKYYFIILQTSRPAGPACFRFHGKGTMANGILPAQVLREHSRQQIARALIKPAPLWGAAAAAAEGSINRRNTKNPLAQRLGFFVWSLTALGSKRGEQPLFHGSSALNRWLFLSVATKQEAYLAVMLFTKGIKLNLRENALHGKQIIKNRSSGYY